MKSITTLAWPKPSVSRRRWRSRLGLDPGYVMPAFEDQFYYLHQERQLPVNVDPADNQLEDPEERERIRRVFERGLDTPVGFVLPLQRGVGKAGPEWQTGLWMLRGEQLVSDAGRFARGPAAAAVELALGESEGRTRDA